MKEPDFGRYSLALLKEGKIVFYSTKSGLRPLVEAVAKFKDSGNRFILHDKVIGLAAARLVVYSGMVSEAVTPLASGHAVQLLNKYKIKISAEKIVENILNRDKSGLCPMEQKAAETEDNEKFFQYLIKNSIL